MKQFFNLFDFSKFFKRLFYRFLGTNTFLAVKEIHKKNLLQKAGVVAVGIATKKVGGKDTGEPCITVFVKQKVPRAALLEEDIVPEELDGVKTDVVEIGEIRALQLGEEHRKKYRPAVGGISLGHYKITAGTLGAIVYKDNKPYILTNTHVGCPHWEGAQKGDTVLQPGSYDGGKMPEDKIGEVEDYVEIKDSGNLADASLIRVDEKDVKPELLGLGVINPNPVRPKVGDVIKKSSRTSGVNTGKVLAVNVSAMVNMSSDLNKPWVTWWEDQIFTDGNFVKPGDSGSLVVLNDGRPCGLVFAGSEYIGVMTPIDTVQKMLGFEWAPVKTGYIALGNWLQITNLKVKVRLKTSLRSAIGLDGAVISALKPNTELEIIEIGGVKDNYVWVRVKIVKEA